MPTPELTELIPPNSGKVITLAAANGGGKTLLSSSLAYITAKKGFNVTVASYEVPQTDMAHRFLRQEEHAQVIQHLINPSEIPTERRKHGILTVPGFHALPDMAAVPEWIEEKYSQYQPSLVVLDYMQIMHQHITSRGGVANWTQKLATLAAKHDITILILSSLPRGGSLLNSPYMGATANADMNLVVRRGKDSNLEVSSDQKTWHTYLTDREYMAVYTPAWYQAKVLDKFVSRDEQEQMATLPNAYVKELHPYLRPEQGDSTTDLIIAQLQKRYDRLEPEIQRCKEENFKAFIDFD